MKQISVIIPDNKESLFIELMKSLSFVQKIESIDTNEIPEWHKTIIDERIENYKKNPENYRDWSEVQEDINKKYGL